VTSLRIIAQVLGVSKTTVWRDVQSNRVRTVQQVIEEGPRFVTGADGKQYAATRNDSLVARAIAHDALQQGRTVAEVATAFNVSERTIRRWRTG